MIVVFTSSAGLGCTFLNWSLHWLSGDKNHWRESVKKWVDLPDNPLTDISAHLFQKNHPYGLTNWQAMIDCFYSYDHLGKDYAFYGYTDPYDYNEHQSCISYTLNKKIKLILLGCDYLTYQIYRRCDDPSLNHSVEARNFAVLKNVKKLFSTVQNLESLIDTPGKARKFLSLSMKNLRHDSDLRYKKNFSKNKKFFFINCKDLLENGKEQMTSMFKFLDRKIDNTRMEHWLKIYAEWRKFLLPTSNFYKNLPKILHSIVHGNFFPLNDYRLDIFTEAIIQHELMLKYRTHLLVEHLDHFPDNTRELTQYLKDKKK